MPATKRTKPARRASTRKSVAKRTKPTKGKTPSKGKTPRPRPRPQPSGGPSPRPGGGPPPRPGPTPIQHVVVIVKENHGFDNYFGSFGAGVNGEVLPQAPNPPPWDPNHRHEAWMTRSTVTTYKVQYKENDIGGYFKLARAFTLCDNYFSQVAGPSTPNHLMLIAADAPIINNPKQHMYNPQPGDAYKLSSLPGALDKSKISWANYGGYAFHFVAELANSPNNHTRDLFIHDAQKGNLPAVSWVYGDGRPDLSEHPQQNVTDGMNWTVDQIKAVIAGGLWPNVAIIVTWDDWGGWYDHVVPPVKEKWSHGMAAKAIDAHPEFDGQPFCFGSRVPCLVISPYAKAGYVCKQENSHVSVVKFIETVFGLAPLNQRDRDSNGLSDCFDFNQKPLPAPQL